MNGLKEAETVELKAGVGRRAKCWPAGMNGRKPRRAGSGFTFKSVGLSVVSHCDSKLGDKRGAGKEIKYFSAEQTLDFIPGDSTAFPEDPPTLGHPIPAPDLRT